MSARDFYTLRRSDVGKPTITAWGRSWGVQDFLGQVQPQDVGKRVYRVRTDDGQRHILQVENDQQRDRRIERGPAAVPPALTVWEIDAIQFPRLLAEINAAGLTAQQWADLSASMDLPRERIAELFDRAEQTWDAIRDLWPPYPPRVSDREEVKP